MRRRLTDWASLVLLAAALLRPGSAAAAEPLQADVRLSASSQEAVWVGQEVELYLELWSDGFSFGEQQFVLPEVLGGFLLEGDSTTVKLSENRAGAAWQGLRYSLLFYPQAAGPTEVPSFNVHFTARAAFGSEPTAFSFQTEPLVVEARWPPGVRPGGLLVTTADFKLEAGWDRELPADGPLQLLTGDALTLRVQRRAADVPGMVFAPLPAPEIDGLGIYADPPRVNDRVNRGELVGERTDRMTFVCETPGSYQIPAWSVQWWDPDRQQLAKRVIPALQLEVAVNPAYGQAAATSSEGAREDGYGRAFLALIVVLILGAAVRRFGGVLLLRLRGAGRRGTVASSPCQRRTGRLLALNPRRGG